MFKRGQITTFLLIGIFILGAIGLLLYFRQAQVEKLPGAEIVPEEVKPIQLYVEECLKTTSIKLIDYMAVQGGKIELPENAYTSDFYDINYGFYNKSVTLPTTEEMQEELSRQISSLLPVCTNNFEDFKKQGMVIEEKNISANTIISRNNVDFVVSYPIKIIKDDGQYSMEKFAVRIPVPLGRAHDIAGNIIAQNQQGFILGTLVFPDMRVDMLPSTPDTVVFAIRDNRTLIENRTFMFMYAHQITINQNPEIEPILNPVFNSGIEYQVQVSATDWDYDEIKFSTDSDYFRIDPITGEMKGTTPARGHYPVRIIAEDTKGGRDEEFVIFAIV